jgi:tRNA (guanine37-N1)-methyltransferase
MAQENNALMMMIMMMMMLISSSSAWVGVNWGTMTTHQLPPVRDTLILRQIVLS